MAYPTLGFISTWPVYQGTTIDRYASSLLQGICAGGQQYHCNLLMGCGFSKTGSRRQNSVWPVPGSNVQFVPVGPWNCDGLIIVPDEATPDQLQYVTDLVNSGYPVISTTPEGPGTVVSIDNSSGIQAAFSHLYEHGHRNIAFIAGNSGNSGDSGERFRAFHSALSIYGLTMDEDLIIYGEHNRLDGAAAMSKIISSGKTFSAVIASNDLSCLGAMEVLKSSGLRIPHDVAVIGFDDILDAQTGNPSLTTVRHPTYKLGHKAVETLVNIIEGKHDPAVRVIVPTQLIIRESCGCGLRNRGMGIRNAGPFDRSRISKEMAAAAAQSTRVVNQTELDEQCLKLVEKIETYQRDGLDASVYSEMKSLLQWTIDRGEDVSIWSQCLDRLQSALSGGNTQAPNFQTRNLDELIANLRTEVSSQIQKQVTAGLLNHMDMMADLGFMTADMQSAVTADEISRMLPHWLQKLGIHNTLVCLFQREDENLATESTILLGSGKLNQNRGVTFTTRDFPPIYIYPADQPLQIALVPMDIDDKVQGFVAFQVDNLELCAAVVHNMSASLRMGRLYQDAVEGRRLAEEANNLKGKFLSMVSHELRTPLSLIIGLSEISIHSRQPVLTDIEKIHSSAQHLSRLIGDVLDLASSEAGQLRIASEKMDLCAAIQVAAPICQQLAEEKGLEFNLQLPDKPVRISGDRTRIRQIILNLVSNAVKFTQEGKISLSVSSTGHQVEIRVSDTGMGISEDQKQGVFNEFYRTDQAYRSGIGGMGLGLAVTRQLVDAHHGCIDVRSPGEFGCGTTFIIQIPCLMGSELSEPIAAPEFPGVQRICILAKSNEDAVNLSKSFTTTGYKFCCFDFDEKEEYLEKIILNQPDAIILSEEIGKTVGWSISRKIHSRNELFDLPVFTYAYNPEKDQGEIIEISVFNQAVESEKIKQVLGGISTDKSPQTILVVDDDPAILDMQCRMVTDAEMIAIPARSGQEALKILETRRPDLIILDLMMPGMDGFDLITALQEREALRSIPVIILSAKVLTEQDVERLNKGVAIILGKGLFTQKEILEHIDTALSRKSNLGSATRQLVRKAISHIQQKYAEPITTEIIARQIGISPDYLSECFRLELGLTPVAYIRRYRIKQACELLRENRHSITQIALDTGFSDNANFTRAFIREMGVNPRTYRRNQG